MLGQERRLLEKAMTKSELIRKLAAANRHMHHDEVERIVGVFFEHIAAALAQGDRVELRGFGTFSVRHRGARPHARNPRTGATVSVSDKHVPFFKAGKALQDRLNRPD